MWAVRKKNVNGIWLRKLKLKKGRMRTATIEILKKGEVVLGSHTAGEYFVREYEDKVEMSGSFYTTMNEAEAHVRKYQDEEK